MTRKPALILGLMLGLVVGAGCAPEGRPSKVSELDPYVGRYPPAARGLPPKPQPPPSIPQPARSLKGATIVVDAGHGGHDPGARGVSAAPEKQINLSIATQLARALSARGANVISTRNGDRFIELEDRAAMADSHRADLFISIHADSSKKPGVSGATVYVARSASSASQNAARCIAAALERSGIECRGVHGAGFRVLVGHSRPAVLVETGFLTNRADAQRLNTAAYQSRVADAIAEGVAQHFRK